MTGAGRDADPAPGPARGAGPRVLWSGDLEGWSASASPASRGALRVDPEAGGALRFDFELAGPGAWAIARREAALALPRHYVVSLRLRGRARPNQLQVKLVAPDGASVWWWRRDLAFPPDPQRLVLRRASLERAWGPGGEEPGRIGALEIAVAAGQAGPGTLWVEELRIEPREPGHGPPQPCGVRASSSAPGHEPACALEAGARTGWRPAGGDPGPWLELDLGRVCEWGGLAVDFAGGRAPASRVLASDDGARWTPLAEDPGGPGASRWLRTGEAESRFARLELAAGAGGGIARVAVVPIERAASPARFAAAAARASPRGRFPRHLLGEQAYWALVGGDGDLRKGLLSEDGALEVDAEAFTLEPFLWSEGRLLTWADVERHASLAEGCLPIPSVEWRAEGLRLRITGFAAGPPGRSVLVARYELESAGGAARDVRLFVAIRPYQVTPAWQGLGLAGAVAPIERLERVGARVRVDGARQVVAVSAPDGFGAARCGEGLGALSDGRLPAAAGADDPLGFAEGAFAFALRPEAGRGETVVLAVPLFPETPLPPEGLGREEAAVWGAERLAEVAAHWRSRLAGVPVALPPSAAPFEASLRASLAWILVNREGPRIQPGPRAYRRSWIRDGALTSAALAEMGFADEARAFLRWYAPHQHADGRVPCAVGRRGVDPAVEHDSHGQLAWGVVEVFRLTGDRAFLGELWPRVRRAVDAIAALRGERTGEAFRGGACFGLLPESISHEGYASRPVHAYWDDFFGVCGLAAAAEAAVALDEPAEAARIGALRDAMRRDLHASIRRSVESRGIDFLPGSVELADFDPTSSAIALDPCGEGARLPRAALERTFERYWEEFEVRRRGETAADAYSPYEARNAAALLFLGWKARALALLEWLIADQRPVAWRQWPEVVTRDPRAPRFLGDLPHGWVASGFVRAVRRLLAWEREEDGALVLAAGVPEAWVREPPGVRLTGLPTYYGPLHLALRAEGDDTVHASLGAGLRPPPGGIVLESPCERPLRGFAVDGRARSVEDPRRVRLERAPAEIVLRY